MTKAHQTFSCMFGILMFRGSRLRLHVHADGSKWCIHFFFQDVVLETEFEDEKSKFTMKQVHVHVALGMFIIVHVVRNVSHYSSPVKHLIFLWGLFHKRYGPMKCSWSTCTCTGTCTQKRWYHQAGRAFAVIYQYTDHHVIHVQMLNTKTSMPTNWSCRVYIVWSVHNGWSMYAC